MIETFIVLVSIAMFLTVMAFWQRGLFWLIFAYLFWFLAGAYYYHMATTIWGQLTSAIIIIFAHILLLYSILFL